MDDYSKFIHKSRYARWREEDGRRETWEETVTRYIDFFKNRVPDSLLPVLDSAQQSILALDVMPSMRALMTAGKALDETNVAGYNCCFVAVDNPIVFDEIMYILMCGTGVGFSIESEFVNKLPIVPKDLKEDEQHKVIVFEDSRTGWAGGFREFISNLYDGRICRWDLSLLRKAGARIKTFGGRASGPEPLADLLAFTRDIFTHAAGRRLTTLECHDLVCKIADIVVVGGVRRSALISLSDLEDESIRYAKHGRWWENSPHRALANNSAVYKSKPPTGTYMREMLSLYDSQSGERGVFNREAAKKKMQQSGRDISYDIGTNPCQPGWAKLLTPDGVTTLADVKIGDKIWSKEGWTTVVNKWSTGVKPVYRYATTAGVFYGTENHKLVSSGVKVEAKYAESIDIITGPYSGFGHLDTQDVIDGLVIGDGIVHKASNSLVLLCIGQHDYGYFGNEVAKFILRERPGISPYAYEVITTITSDELVSTYERRIPDRFFRDLRKASGFLRGLYSSSGHVHDNMIIFQHTSNGLIEDVQLLLNALGIRSYKRTTRRCDGEYVLRDKYEVVITTSRARFMEAIGFTQSGTAEESSVASEGNGGIAHDVVDVSLVSKEEVFDITVDNRSHTYWTQGCDVSNCGEIILRSKQFCNLSEVVLRRGDSIADVFNKVAIATVLGTLQSTLTDFDYLSDEWRKNTEEERLLGVSLTGVMDWWHDGSVGILEGARRLAMYINSWTAQILGIPLSAAITCVKPSGTVSQLVDSSSGMHSRYSPYYIRTVRADNNDPMCRFLKDQGVPHEPDVTKPKHTTVFSFPRKSPEGAVCTKDMTAIDQLEMWLTLANEWCDHNPSTTVQVKEDEWVGVFSWMYDHWDSLCGIALLPYSEHTYQQAPYQEISKEEYEEAMAEIPTIDWWELSKYEVEDGTTGQHDLACSGGVCEVVDIS